MKVTKYALPGIEKKKQKTNLFPEATCVSCDVPVHFAPFKTKS